MLTYEDRTPSSPTSSDIKGLRVITVQHTSHTFSAWAKIDDNKYKRSCTDCDGYQEGNHNYQWIIVRDSNGQDLGHVKDCVECHDRKDADVHTWSEWWNAGAAGEERCTVCNLDEAKQTRPHDFNIYWLYRQPATCTIDGIRVYDCNNCLYEEQVIVPATGHSYTTPAVPSDGTDATCNNCGYENMNIRGKQHEKT